jgi:hypothetical protein
MWSGIDLSDIPEIVRVRCRWRRGECGSVRIGSAVYERLMNYWEASGILDRIPAGVKRKICDHHRRFNPRKRTAREGMNKCLGHATVPLPQRLCPHRAWMLWGPISIGALAVQEGTCDATP